MQGDDRLFRRALIAARTLVSVLLLLSSNPAAALVSVTIGILADVDPKSVDARWLPLKQALNQAIPGYDFHVVALDGEQIQRAVHARQIDFILTEPSSYVLMNRRSGLSAPLATLAILEGGKRLSSFGGVIFTRAEQPEIHSLADLGGRRIAVSPRSLLSEYLAQVYELKLAGVEVDEKQLLRTGHGAESVVAAVLEGHADAGFVAAGALEKLAHDHKLERSRLKIVNPQTLPDFPFAVSTRLYPYWPLSALPHTNKDLKRRLSAFLLGLRENRTLADSLDITGFDVPSDYSSVETVLQALHWPPFDTEPEFTLSDVWQRYRWTMTGILWSMLLVAILSFQLMLSNRRLRGEQDQVRQQAERLRESNHLLDSVINNIPILVFLQRASDLKYVLLNQAGQRLLGSRANGDTDAAAIPLLEPELAEPLNRRDAEVLASAHLVDMPEVTLATPQGERIVNIKKLSLRDAGGDPQYLLGIAEDITQRKQAEDEIKSLAFYDPLTGLPNRRLLSERIQQAMASNMRHGYQGGLLMIDLDHFKTLNDTQGHGTGDELLRQVAQRLVSCVREMDTVARLGGDEFVILLQELGPNRQAAAEQTEMIGEKILDQLNREYDIAGFIYHNTPSIGVSLFGGNDVTSDELLKQADLAMYQAKQEGRNALRFFDPQMQHCINQRLAMETRLRQACTQRQLQLYYQLQVDFNARPIGAEALLRWSDAEFGSVSPAEFIPLAEETGLILPIGDWVLDAACEQLRAWREHPLAAELVMAVNLSVRQIENPDFAHELEMKLRRFDINPARLKLELTESVLLNKTDETITTMARLKALGVSCSLDDFGTGYSSLQYLRRLPINQIKIDRSFVNDIDLDNNNLAIVRTILAMADSLGLEVIAEGVETQAQFEILKDKGCGGFQGYLFAKPLPVNQFEDLLASLGDKRRLRRPDRA